MKTLTKQQSPFAVKAVDQTARTFSGLASTWELDQGGDVVEQGAYARTLENWKRSPTKIIPLIDNHNSYKGIDGILGKLTDATETDTGLECVFEVKQGPIGDEVLNTLRGGYLNGLSIGYQAVKWNMVKPDGAPEWDAVRHLTEVKLMEVSLTPFPMNESALVDLSSVKSFLKSCLHSSGSITADERGQLKLLQDQISALLRNAAADEQPKGLAPDDPKRLAMEATLRALTIRGLGTRV